MMHCPPYVLLAVPARLQPIQPPFPSSTGWAIEGAIGSEYKIDASYLSPHVNMASRLEAATKQYGVTVLLSDAFVAMLSPRVAARVRQVDCVTVKGSQQPVGLYTYDSSTEGLDVWIDVAQKTAKVCLGEEGRDPMLHGMRSHTGPSPYPELNERNSTPAWPACLLTRHADATGLPQPRTRFARRAGAAAAASAEGCPVRVLLAAPLSG